MPDKKKNVIDVIKDGKDTIFPSQDQAWRPGVIHLTSRTRRPRCDISTNIVMYLQILSISRCVTCSGQKCLHVNIYVEEAKQRRETDNMRERQKEKTQSKNRETTEVVGDHQLPYEPTEQGKGTHNSQNELNMFQFKGKSSNVFNISINYPPNADEKEDIKRMNTEDIFPENIAAPNIEEDEKCEHGNEFSPKLTPIWPVSDTYSRLTTRYVGRRLYLSFSYQQVCQSLHQFREVGYQLVKAHLEDWKWRSQALPPPPRCPPH